MLAYLHIPFCDSKCHYCSFNSYVDKFDAREAYMKALYEQLCFELERFNTARGSIETLFIGGGTPSTVTPELYRPVLELLTPYLQKDAEITTEANPNSATEKWLAGMKELGVNRVSFGVQSFNTDKLKALNRAHSPEQAIKAVKTAYHLGFKHLSIDLIYNYAEDTRSLLSDDIKTAFTLPIDHISAYELTIEGGTKFAATPDARQENEALAFFVAEEIKKRGFEHYEISNFGTYQSRHNKGYWELKEYIGAGAGAVGFKHLSFDASSQNAQNTKSQNHALSAIRFYPQTGLETYIAKPLSMTEEPLSAKDLMTEKIFLGLRSNIGIEREILSNSSRKNADMLVREGKLTEKGNRYYNPDFFIADALALYLLE